MNETVRNTTTALSRRSFLVAGTGAAIGVTFAATAAEAATQVMGQAGAKNFSPNAWVVIAGDRTPVGGHGRVSHVPFLGQRAPLPQGPWVLAALLGCPVRLLFCLRTGANWEVAIEPFAERVVLARGDRQAMVDGYVARYAQRLEWWARRDPLQWYNFFDFWAQ